MSNRELVGKQLKFHHSEVTYQNKVAVYVDVYFEDENGGLYKFSPASMKHELIALCDFCGGDGKCHYCDDGTPNCEGGCQELECAYCNGTGLRNE